MEQNLDRLEKSLWGSSSSIQARQSNHRYWLYVGIIVVLIILIGLFFMLRSGGTKCLQSKCAEIIDIETAARLESNTGLKSDITGKNTEVEVVFDNKATNTDSNKVQINYNDLMGALDKE